MRSRRESVRLLPVLFSVENIKQILAVARSLPDNHRARLRGATYEMVFAILAGLGIRIGEVANLRVGSIDLDRELLEISNSKFGKDRLVPFGSKIAAMLLSYLKMRESGGFLCGPTDYLFSWSGRSPLSTNSIRNTFREEILPYVDVERAPGTFGPHVHGLRHSFAVRTLLRWYQDGDDPAARLHHLSTFLGHVRPSTTAVYLTMTWELLAAANGRFERYVFDAPAGDE